MDILSSYLFICVQGSLVRIWDCKTGQLLYEFRRGSEYTRIYSIAWHPQNRLIGVTSSRETIHLFKLDPTLESSGSLERRDSGSDQTAALALATHPEARLESAALQAKTSLSFIKNYLPAYFSSEWHFAHAKSGLGPSYIIFCKEEESSFIGKQQPAASMGYELTIILCSDPSRRRIIYKIQV
jgi:WD40 repeat protein